MAKLRHWFSAQNTTIIFIYIYRYLVYNIYKLWRVQTIGIIHGLDDYSFWSSIYTVRSIYVDCRGGYWIWVRRERITHIINYIIVLYRLFDIYTQRFILKFKIWRLQNRCIMWFYFPIYIYKTKNMRISPYTYSTTILQNLCLKII